jgi:ABC-2 type transport system ATP-binding protein
MSALLQVCNLVKTYGDFIAVAGISFDIKEGEIFSLLGPNGAGKTTTISMLSTLYPPNGGDATIFGYSVVKDPMAVRKHIGVVPQEIALYDDLTALENLRFWGRMYGLEGHVLAQRIAEVLDQVGLTEKAKNRIRTYSGGMKRRINIAAGLLHKPRLLFMDEPTVGIDPQSRRVILDTIKQLNSQGMTVLYTTHHMEEAAELSHRIGIIDHGRMIAIGTLQELTRQVGTAETLVLHFDSGQDPARLTSALAQLPGVMQIDSGENQVSLTTSHAKHLLAPAIAKAGETGINIRSIDIREPNLETVFLHLTGRALRD